MNVPTSVEIQQAVEDLFAPVQVALQDLITLVPHLDSERTDLLNNLLADLVGEPYDRLEKTIAARQREIDRLAGEGREP